MNRILFSLALLSASVSTIFGGDSDEPPFKVTAQRLARGRYLVEGPAHCFACHSELNPKTRLAVQGRKGSGRISKAGLNRPWDQVIPNISPDVETGAGSWKDEDFVRALRQGIGHDGRTLYTMMPYRFFRQISDEDVSSIIVYIRSIPAVKNALPKTVLPDEVKEKLKPFPDPGRIPPPDLSTPAKRGQYLVTVAQCSSCHTPRRDGQPIPGLEFAGGEIFRALSGAHVASANLTPGGPNFVASANLTKHPSGIPYYNAAMFVKTIRAGAVNGVRQLDSVMPWASFKNMTDDDLKAIFAFLRTLKPVSHRVDNDEPPTYCKLCGQKHGAGEMNGVSSN